MKVFIVAVSLLVAVSAEPPRYRQQFSPQKQYFFARQQEEPAAAAAAAAPYPASGFRPAGPAFNLPQRQVQAAQQQYGAPSAPEQQYGAPATPQQRYGAPEPQQKYGPPATPPQQYGPPQDATTTAAPDAEDATTVSPSTEPESEPVNTVNELEDEEVDENQPQQTGEYYVALPDGRLQRVRYVSRQNPEAMKYFAKIRAENVEPLRGPIYAYSPLQKLQVFPAKLQVSVAPALPSLAITPADAKPQKLEIEPVAAQVQYQYDNPAEVLQLTGAPVSSAFATYTANYQVPAAAAAAADSKYILTIQ